MAKLTRVSLEMGTGMVLEATGIEIVKSCVKGIGRTITLFLRGIELVLSYWDFFHIYEVLLLNWLIQINIKLKLQNIKKLSNHQ